MMSASRIVRQLKYAGTLLANAAMAVFALAQLYSAWKFGEIYFGSLGPSNWIRWTDEPVWFVAGATVYGVGLLVFATILMLVLREDWIIWRNVRRRSRRPPVDTTERDRQKRG